MATITVTELATELNTDSRTARKFLRSITEKDAQPGKGSRWAIEKREVRSMKAKFAKFEKANEDAKLARELAKNATPKTGGDPAVEKFDELGYDREPSDEDLDEIDRLED